MYPAVDSIIRIMIALTEPHVWDLTSAVIEPILRNYFCDSVSANHMHIYLLILAYAASALS